MFGSIANFANMLKQAKQLQGVIGEQAARLKSQRFTGAAGGGLVEVEVSGANEVVSCRIDPSLMPEGDRELVEDLLVTAVNHALAKSREAMASSFQEAAGGMAIPGLQEALGKLGELDTKPSE